MSNRREFSKSIKIEILKRATKTNDRGLRVVYCEGCGLPAKKWQFDHTIADGLQIDKTSRLTASDGKLLCSGDPTRCHDIKTDKHDKPTIAKAKRNESNHLGIKSAKTALSGRTQEEIREAKRANSKPSLAWKPMFRDI